MQGLSRRAGVDASAAATLLSTATPMVLGYLGYLIRRDGLDAAGVTHLLRHERERLAGGRASGSADSGRQVTPPERQPGRLPLFSRWNRIRGSLT